jgi:serine/threonine-protein kinase RsbW
VEVTLPNQLSQINRVHQALDDLTLQHSLPARSGARLHVALEEHLTNIISHGYRPGGQGTIVVRFSLAPPDLRVQIEDDASAFNPLELPNPDTSLPVEDKPLGGLGVLMIRRSVDELEYSRTGGWNILVMKSQVS